MLIVLEIELLMFLVFIGGVSELCYFPCLTGMGNHLLGCVS